MGVDRGSMAAVTRSRDDYADVPLADLFNRLAGNRTGIILNRATADQYHLQVGQTIKLQISALNVWSEIDVPIVGLVNYFPTLDPSQGFFGLMSIDVIFETVGSELPHDLWLSLQPDTDLDALRAEISTLGYPILSWNDPQTALQAALNQPLRRGILGFLSVGFVAAIGLTLIGAIIQNAAAFRAQAAQLGALRAMGLSGLSVAAYLLIVQTLAASSGAASGTLIGMATTLLYLPLLDFSTGLPPYLVRVAWEQIALVYAAFAGVLIVVILTTTLIMSRQNVTTLVKLGE
jgi:putative ABC transport system permease protein